MSDPRTNATTHRVLHASDLSTLSTYVAPPRVSTWRPMMDAIRPKPPRVRQSSCLSHPNALGHRGNLPADPVRATRVPIPYICPSEPQTTRSAHRALLHPLFPITLIMTPRIAAKPPHDTRCWGFTPRFEADSGRKSGSNGGCQEITRCCG